MDRPSTDIILPLFAVELDDNILPVSEQQWCNVSGADQNRSGHHSRNAFDHNQNMQFFFLWSSNREPNRLIMSSRSLNRCHKQARV